MRPAGPNRPRLPGGAPPAARARAGCSRVAGACCPPTGWCRSPSTPPTSAADSDAHADTGRPRASGRARHEPDLPRPAVARRARRRRSSTATDGLTGLGLRPRRRPRRRSTRRSTSLGINYYFPHLVGGRPRADGTSLPYPGVPGAWAHRQDGPRHRDGLAGRAGQLHRVARHAGQRLPGRRRSSSPRTARPIPTRSRPDGSVQDPDRAALPDRHVGAVLDAIDAGVDVRGYFAWSLLDNFEWAWGLSRSASAWCTSTTRPSAVRPKTSASIYRQIIEANGLPGG